MKTLREIPDVMTNGGFLERFLLLAVLILPVDLIVRFDYIERWGIAKGMLAILAASVFDTFIVSLFLFLLSPRDSSKTPTDSD